MSNGLNEQTLDEYNQKYGSFSIEEFVKFAMSLPIDKSEFDDGRNFVMHTGKQGAIEQYIAMYKYTDPTEADILEYRSQLEAELKEGAYRIDSGSMDFIKYLG